MTDFSDVLRAALRAADCDDASYRFDSHSPITMGFTDVGDITFVPEDDDVWIWHELTNTTVYQLSHNAGDMLDVLAEPVDYLRAGCLNLRTENESLWLGGQLSNHVRESGELLAAALDVFHAQVTRVRAML